jgi:sodium/hydrogen exchanger 8
MGMGVFTGGFKEFDLSFSVVAFVACLIGRALNIFPLSWMANLCRKRNFKISAKMQVVLWFAGLRGAIAFALSENMPGPHKDVYATATLTICIVTTVFCGGFTERMLTLFGMKDEPAPQIGSYDSEDDELNLHSLTYKPPTPRRHESGLLERQRRIQEGIKGVWYRFDERFLKPHFGGEQSSNIGKRLERHDSKDHDSANMNRDDETTDDDTHIHWTNSSMPSLEMGNVRTMARRESSRNSNEEMVSLTAARQD